MGILILCVVIRYIKIMAEEKDERYAVEGLLNLVESGLKEKEG